MITISAPGKIHLLGEHAVVYGKPALLTAINLRLYLTLSPSRKNIIESGLIPLQQILESTIKKKFKLSRIPAYSITIKSDIPIGSGHGSSAALSAAFTAALLTLLKIDWDQQLVNDMAYEGERFFHGNPSGGDIAAVSFGGFIWFRKELESIKIIHSIPQKIHHSIEQFFIIDSGKPIESTKDMVQKVAQLRSEKSKKVKVLFDEQEELTKQMLVSLVDGDHQSLISVMKKSQHNLELLGVVGKKAKWIVKKIESIGGAAKISGAGGFTEGSGILIAYHTDPKKLLSYIHERGWKATPITLGEVGLKREE